MMNKRFEGMLMMERPKTLWGREGSVSHVNAHSKSAWTKTTGLSPCLDSEFASAATLPCLPLPQLPSSGLWFR